KARLEALREDLSNLREQETELRARWQNEKEPIEEMKAAKAELGEAQIEVDQANRETDLQRAAELQYGLIPELESKVKEAEARLAELHAGDGGTMLADEVTEEDVAEVVAKWTGIPVSRLMEGEGEKVIQMEDRLHGRVIGQQEAIEAVSNALRRSRAGLSDPSRPIGSFLFLLPTRVGKTEVGTALARGVV